MPTAAELMTSAVPRARPGDTVGSVQAALRSAQLQEASHVYLLDDVARLIGQVPIETLLTAESGSPLGSLRGEPPVEVRPEDSAETVALLAVERHEADVAVIDNERRLLGAIPIGRLLVLLHEEQWTIFFASGASEPRTPFQRTWMAPSWRFGHACRG